MSKIGEGMFSSHRKKAIAKAVEMGYFSSTKDPLIKKYDLDSDGTFRLKKDQNQWFKTGVGYTI